MGMKPRAKPLLVTYHAYAPPRYGKTNTVCGKKIGEPAKIAGAEKDTWALGWWEVNCKDCLEKKPEEIHIRHVKREGYVSQMTNRTICGRKLNPDADIDYCEDDYDARRNSTCPLCREKRFSKKATVPPHLVASAKVLLSNALISSRNRGERVVRGDCGYCNDRPRRITTCCPLCAFILFRDGTPEQAARNTEGSAEALVANERFVAKKLALPRVWVEDFVHGFDGDECAITYPNAERLGRLLWRTYGHEGRKRHRK